ncbi:DNA-binding transcriptional activator TdcA [Klebsiella aerogenes]|nr:DNA-binding transcriptional activator TdcA [Klebsiella aerogenes]
MKLQDLHVEPLFESEFVLVANRARIGNGTVRLASLQHEQWVLPETNMGYYSELLATLQRSGIRRENIVNTDSVVTIYNLVLQCRFSDGDPLRHDHAVRLEPVCHHPH